MNTHIDVANLVSAADERRLLELLVESYPASTLKTLKRSRKLNFAIAYLAMGRVLHDNSAAPTSDAVYRGAIRDAECFEREDQGDDHFHIGCSDYSFARPLVMTIEAARHLACGRDRAAAAQRLLRLAHDEIARCGQEHFPDEDLGGGGLSFLDMSDWDDAAPGSIFD